MIGDSLVVIGVMHRLLVIFVREKSSVLLCYFQFFNCLGVVRRGSLFVRVNELICFFIVSMTQIGVGHRKLLIDYLPVFRQRQHVFELTDGRIVILFFIQVELSESVVGI